MQFKFPRLLGEINDKDTEFTAGVKKNQELVIIFGVIIIIAFLYFIITSLVGDKRTGTWRYGLCKVFLEQYTFYPTKLTILTAEEFKNSVRIGYLTTNPYGSQESQLMECFYNTSNQGVELSRVTINRQPIELLRNQSERPSESSRANSVDPVDYQAVYNGYKGPADFDIWAENAKVRIDEFNKSIPVIMATDELDLTMPAFLPQSIEELKYD